MSQRTCTEPDCEKLHRARGLCGTHYNQKHQPNRHRKAVVACTTCGTAIEKVVSRRIPFCSYFCRDLHMATHGLGSYSPEALAAATRRMVSVRPRRHVEAEPKWSGRSSPLASTVCAVCGATFFHDARTRRVNCSSRCRNAGRDERKRGRRKVRREDIFRRDDYVCWMCEERCDPALKVPADLAPTVDHLIPRVHGGSDEPDNLATACFRCNSTRGASWDYPASA